jgi:hypothetical protein
MEKLTLGVRLTVTGKGEAPAGAFLPPHAGKSKNKETAATAPAQDTKRNLPMHPLVA